MAEFNNLLDQQRILQRQDLTSTEKFVAIVILSFRNAETGKCNPPIYSEDTERKTICSLSGYSKQCVIKTISSIERKKVITCKKINARPSEMVFTVNDDYRKHNLPSITITPTVNNVYCTVNEDYRHGKPGLPKQIKNKEITNKEQINNTEEKDEDSFSLTPVEKTPRRQPLKKPEIVTQQTWDDFNAIRKAKKAPLTETALIRIQNEAQKAGIDLETALQVCCERGWQGFKAEWYLKDRQNKPAQKPLAKNSEPTPEDFTDNQISMFAWRISREKPYTVLSPGYCESYDQLQRRIESNLRHPEHFKKFIPVLRELHLI